MSNLIPDKLINASIYLKGTELAGTGTVDLPDISYMKEKITGLGIAGEVETPVIGHFESMTLSINWNTVNENAITVLKTSEHQITVHGSIQLYDAGSGKLEPKAVKLVTNTLPKKSGLGKAEPGKKMDNKTELEVMYLKLSYDGEDQIEIDKLNFKCVIDGEDMLAEVRSHLGK